MRRVDELQPVALRLVDVVDAARQDEVVGRPRAGDVQQPLALFEVLDVLDAAVQVEADGALAIGERHERAELEVEHRLRCRRDGGCRSRSGSTTSGNSSPLA